MSEVDRPEMDVHYPDWLPPRLRVRRPPSSSAEENYPRHRNVPSIFPSNCCQGGEECITGMVTSSGDANSPSLS